MKQKKGILSLVLTVALLMGTVSMLTACLNKKEYRLTLENASDYLAVDLRGRYEAGNKVEVVTHTLTDTDLIIRLNGVAIEKISSDSRYWKYSFTMPARDSVLSFSASDGFTEDNAGAFDVGSDISLSVAVFKPFDTLNVINTKGMASGNDFGRGIQLLPASSDTGITSVPLSKRDYLHVSYHFDSVEIINPVKFCMTVPDDSEGYELIREKCGTELEVVIAQFVTYTKNETAGLLPDISDTVIVFRGEKGYHNLLLNSYYNDSIDNKENPAEYYSYSSHKTLRQDSVDKDFDPPIFTVVVADTPECLMITALKSQSVLPADPDVINLQGYIQVGKDEVGALNESYIYDLYDLNEYNVVGIDAHITAVSSGVDKNGEKYLILTVEKFENLETVYVTEKTVINDLDRAYLQDNTPLSVHIVYASMYAGYKPAEVEAMSVKISKATDEDNVLHVAYMYDTAWIG